MLCCRAGDLDLKKCVLLYLLNFLHVAKLLYLLGFEPRDYARSVSFENAAECTTQRFKRTSGVRVMNLLFNDLELSLTDV